MARYAAVVRGRKVATVEADYPAEARDKVADQLSAAQYRRWHAAGEPVVRTQGETRVPIQDTPPGSRLSRLF